MDIGEFKDFVQDRMDKFEKETGRKFSDEFKCGYHAGCVDMFAYAAELQIEREEEIW